MDTVWVWIEEQAVFVIHDELLEMFGGGFGVRDEGIVLSAIARPRNLAAYGSPDAADLAAEYVFGIARNHGFVDGNKRTAWEVAAAFLELNGVAIAFKLPEAVAMVEAAAMGTMSVAEISQWFRARHEVSGSETG